MKLLLDTHILLWDINGDDRLSHKAEEYIFDPDNTIYYSVASLWEVEIKHLRHPKQMGVSADMLDTYCKRAGFLTLDINDQHVKTVSTLEFDKKAHNHHDPFDQILLSQAKTEGMIFLTHDKILSHYKEHCIVLV